VGLSAPLFLAGALAIALPIWLHRLQTQSSDRKPFSSAMLLETSERQVHVKKQLKYLLLLAFRIACLALLALAFAKPFVERAPQAAAAGAGSDLVVVDASLSMGRSGVFEQAQAETRRVIGEAPEGALIQVLVAGTTLDELAPASPDRALHRAALAGMSPSPARIDFGALMTLVENRAAALPKPVRLHLISDFQASAMPARFADVVPAGIAALIPYPVGTGDPVNWGVTGLRESAAGIEVTVRNQGLPDRTADIELSVNGQDAGVRTTSGQGSYTVLFEEPAFADGDNRVEVRLVTDDDLDADNHWYAVVQNDPPAPVPLLTRNPAGLPVTYITAALEAVADQRYSVLPLVAGEFDPRILSRYDWAIVEDIGAVDADLADDLAAFLPRGGNLLAFAGDSTQRLDALPVSGRSLAAADLGSGIDAFRRIATIDDQHPAMTETRGWYGVRVSRSVALGAGDDDVLASLDNGAPFVIEETHGSGRLLLVLSAADNRWNDLPVHAVFVSFLIEAADYLSGRVAGFGSYQVGDALSLGAGAGQVNDPDRNSLLSLAATADARTIRLEQAGIYAVYTAEDESLVAANIDPRESELVSISQDVLDRWRNATFSAESGGGELTAGAAPEPLALWPWLLLALAVLVIAESALGNVHIATRMKAT